MSNVPALLAASLSLDQRQAAEAELGKLALQAGFLPHVLQIVLEQSQPLQVRQAACVYFKNQIKRRWDDEDEPEIPQQDKVVVRDNLVASMVALSGPSDKLLRTQIGEAVSTVAKSDFPEPWQGLITSLVSSFSPTDYNVNLSVLQTAHNIFLPWRSEIRSDQLYSTINFALSQFQDAYFSLFRATASHLVTTTISDVKVLELLGDTMDLLFNLFHDMTAQDLPPAFEDSHDEFFGNDSSDGWFIQFLKWGPSQLIGDVDDPSPTAPLRVRTTILEIAELYALRYNEITAPRLPAFVRAVWELIGTSGPSVREDAMVSQAIRFLSVTVKTGLHTALFRQKETLQALCEQIIVPSMALREHEVEQFEDDPLEYIRRDLSLSSEGSGATRRHAASELVRALISIGLEAEVTEIVQVFVSNGLATYAANPSQNWTAKDSAIYLFTSIAILGSTASQGVTNTNILVDVVKFFSDNVYQDLQPENAVHPIMQVDAIRFIHTFRKQLTKEQLLAVLPLLIRHLASSNYVSYSYAAITIERILFIKHGSSMLFAQADIHESAYPILQAVFAKIRSGNTPEKIAENDYLMKCVMRVIITARQTLVPVFQDILSNLVAILNEISKNPSNPNFNQYCFESLSALMRFVVAGNPTTLEAFEAGLFGPFQRILEQDVDQFIPYVLQVLSQMLELHAASIPPLYRSLLPLLVTPIVWQQKGSVPALVRLIKAYLTKDAANIVANGQLQSVLAVVQQRLIPSKLNDVYGFEVLEAVISYVPFADAQKHFNVILLTLLNRLQQNKTDKYALGFVRFLCFVAAAPVQGLSPGFIVSALESIQAGLWPSLLGNVILPQIPKFQRRDRKVVVVGLTRLLTQCEAMVAPPTSSHWAATLIAILELLGSPDGVTKGAEEVDTEEILTTIDHEEQNAGYQAAFSRLAASEAPRSDPVSYVPDPTGYLKTELQRAVKNDPRVNALLVTAGGQSTIVSAFLNAA